MQYKHEPLDTAALVAKIVRDSHYWAPEVIPAKVLGHLGHCETAEERARAEAALMSLPDEDKRRLFLIPAKNLTDVARSS